MLLFGLLAGRAAECGAEEESTSGNLKQTKRGDSSESSDLPEIPSSEGTAEKSPAYLSRISHYEYDELTDESEYDADGRVTGEFSYDCEKYYDSDGNVIKTVYYGPVSAVKEDGTYEKGITGWIEYEYWEDGTEFLK